MDAGGIAGDQLKQFVERYERLQEEIDTLNNDKSELIKELKGRGFEPKIFKLVIARRRKGKDQCDEEDDLLDLYERAISGTGKDDTPRAHAREDPLRKAVRDFVNTVPDETTVSLVTPDGKGFAVVNTGGKRTVRQLGQEEAAAP